MKGFSRISLMDKNKQLILNVGQKNSEIKKLSSIGNYFNGLGNRTNLDKDLQTYSSSSRNKMIVVKTE